VIPIRERIQTAIDEHVTLTDEDMANLIIKQASRKADFFALVLDEVRRRRRTVAKAVENEVANLIALNPANSSFETSLTPLAVIDLLDALKPLMNTTFKVQGEAQVSWGLATLDHHKQKIVQLAALRNSIDRNIGLHQKAVALLAETGAPCLAKVSIALAKVKAAS
jgi:hypothetical protein